MNHKLRLTTVLLFAAILLPLAAQKKSNTWNPNLPGGYYRNPIIDADYSDPDVCRVGADYYMTASSFACFPGLPILHSTDLVNWELIGYALKDNYPLLPENVGGELDWHKKIQHGNYVWAPAIRYHDGWFYIYCGDPDQGLFMTKAQNPSGPWSEPVWVLKGKGFIDCCPLWDDDGKAYLSHGCAGSRAGVKSVLFVAEMAPDGTRLLGSPRIVFDGHESQPTIEGTKFYKRGDYYYILSPAGGVKTGWQVELRSKNPFGPYEEHICLAQGDVKEINGPHQGAWIDTPSGEDWFIHFQDKYAYGRVVHLQPAKWVEDHLVIGDDKDGDGCGEPVLKWKKPALPSSGDFQPVEDDDFNSTELGFQWQFEGPYSPYWYFCDAAHSRLRLYTVQQPEGCRNLSDIQNALLQKFPTENFTATASLRFTPCPSNKAKGEQAGLIVKGQDYAAVKFVSTSEGIKLQYVECCGAFDGAAETVVNEVALPKEQEEVFVKIKVQSSGYAHSLTSSAQFFYSFDGKKFQKAGAPFTVKAGRWIGAKIGFFASRPTKHNDSGFLDIDYIHFWKYEN